jgi:hypothetical protein
MLGFFRWGSLTMISEQRKEATKLAANLINTIAAAYLLSGLVAPFLPGAGNASYLEIAQRVAAGIFVHMIAQTVLFFGFRDEEPQKGEPNEPDNPDVDNRLGVSDGDRNDFDGLSCVGETREPESAKPEKLDR